MSETVLSTDLRQRIEHADRRFMDAFNAGDIEGACRLIYTSDAVVMPQGAEAVRGMDDIIGFWNATKEQLGLQRAELSTVELQPMGDGAYQIGRVALTLGDGQRVEGKYVVIWKQEGREWKWHVDIFNFNA